VTQFVHVPGAEAIRVLGGHRVRQLRCECGHAFTPDGAPALRQRLVVCRGNAGKKCGSHLLIMLIRNYDMKLIARVSDKDLDVMQERRLEPVAELAYLLNEPVIPDEEG
jgi:hypothetical protein